MNSIISKTARTARKDHVCDYCCQTIHKREKYLYITYARDGTVCPIKAHQECNDIAIKYCNEYGVSEFLVEDFIDYKNELGSVNK